MTNIQQGTKGLPRRFLRNIVQLRAGGHHMVPEVICNSSTERTEPLRSGILAIKELSTLFNNSLTPYS